jgi:hypothetical protein
MNSELKTTLMIACVFITFAIFGTILNLTNKVGLTGNVVSDSQTEKLEEVIILNHQLGYDSRGNLAVSGTIQNNAKKQLGYLEIKIKFYDKDKALLETSSESINDLASGEKWKFSSIYPGFNIEEVASYDIVIGEYW